MACSGAGFLLLPVFQERFDIAIIGEDFSHIVLAVKFVFITDASEVRCAAPVALTAPVALSAPAAACGRPVNTATLVGRVVFQ